MPWVTRHAAPPEVRAAHTARSAPAGSLVNVGHPPLRFASWPRTNTTTDPSAEMLSVVRSMPSSSRKPREAHGTEAGRRRE